MSTWLYRIAVSKSMDHLRKKKKEKKRFAFVQSLFGANEELVHDPPDFVHPGVKLDNKEKCQTELFKAIDQLPEKQKIAFTLNRVEGLSYLGDQRDNEADGSISRVAFTQGKKEFKTYP